MRRDDALRLLAEHLDELESMGVKSLALFGSVARDEAGPESDVDVLISTSRQIDLFDLAAIHLRLEDILSSRVDPATEVGPRPRYRERIERDLVHVNP